MDNRKYPNSTEQESNQDVGNNGRLIGVFHDFLFSFPELVCGQQTCSRAFHFVLSVGSSVASHCWQVWQNISKSDNPFQSGEGPIFLLANAQLEKNEVAQQKIPQPK